jgi:predicted nucleic acid-binding protein
MSSSTILEAPALPVCAIVIDTQVVMDWLVFKDPMVEPLVQAITAGRLRWIGRPAMLDELRHVLARGIAASYKPDLCLIEETFAQQCTMIAAEPLPALRLHCRDKDDQKFIDLALCRRLLAIFPRSGSAGAGQKGKGPGTANRHAGRLEQLAGANRHRGATMIAAAPATPPGMRVRTRRFESLRS